jgi:hypothetical protein
VLIVVRLSLPLQYKISEDEKNSLLNGPVNIGGAVPFKLPGKGETGSTGNKDPV